MKYSKNQREDNSKLSPGTHTVNIVREMANAKTPSMHTFILEEGKASIFWNVWLTQLEDLAKVIGVSTDADGSIDTASFVGKSFVVLIGEKLTREGKSFVTVLEYYAPVTDKQLSEPAKTGTDLGSIPF